MTAEAQASDPREAVKAARARLLAGYRPTPGVADELYDGKGAMRPVWRRFIAQLARHSPEEAQALFARGDQYLRDAGVFFRQYSADPQQERDWPLSHIPVLLPEQEWNAVCEGLAQRAELLEAVVADLYGPGRLVSEGHLPPELVTENPEWHRPLVGIAPASGHFLHFIAFEIGRSPDGSWLVLGDRTQAPSGAGFALENRMASARIFPKPFPRANVRRLAGFFRAFREAMEGLPGAQGSRTAILSPGVGNDTYFEHAYIARYLGLMLLEGEDLIVEDGAVQVRTVSGPRPVSVLWRRLDAAYADPLELEEGSAIGTPGLVEALRQSSVNMVNALGSGILETRAFMAFLPKIAEIVLDAPLKLPNIATWWCGQESERTYVTENIDSMFLSEALTRALPFDIGVPSAAGDALRDPRGAAMRNWIAKEGRKLVGQEAVTLSTTPAWVDGGLQPRPMTVRVFAARTAGGWVFLPGGYARIGQSGDTTALSMQRGGSVSDVWIMRDGPAPDETLFDGAPIQREWRGMLPSRAADNFFWLGRYVERAEGQIRLLRAYHLRCAETGAPTSPRLRRIADHLATLGIDAQAPLTEALAPALDAARACTGRVRDRFSVDGWAALAELTRSFRTLERGIEPGDEAARALSTLLRRITGFAGQVQENMQRNSGWRFLTLGRSLERADGAAAVLAAFCGPDAGPGLPDVALEYGDARVTHQRRYRVDPTRETVTDLMALDASNPRSILFQAQAMRGIAEELPRASVDGRVSPVLRLLLPLAADLAVATPDEIDARRLARLRRTFGKVSARLTASYLV